MTKRCAYSKCRQPFEAKRPHAKYCHDACRAAAFKQRARERVPPHPSGLQVSYRKAVEHLVQFLLAWQLVQPSDAGECAEAVLSPALPDRQRDRLTS